MNNLTILRTLLLELNRAKNIHPIHEWIVTATANLTVQDSPQLSEDEVQAIAMVLQGRCSNKIQEGFRKYCPKGNGWILSAFIGGEFTVLDGGYASDGTNIKVRSAELSSQYGDVIVWQNIRHFGHARMGM